MGGTHGDQIMYFNFENANQDSVNSSMHMPDLMTINTTGMINVSWGAIQLPLRLREQPYKKLCVQTRAES